MATILNSQGKQTRLGQIFISLQDLSKAADDVSKGLTKRLLGINSDRETRQVFVAQRQRRERL